MLHFRRRGLPAALATAAAAAVAAAAAAAGARNTTRECAPELDTERGDVSSPRIFSFFPPSFFSFPQARVSCGADALLGAEEDFAGTSRDPLVERRERERERERERKREREREREGGKGRRAVIAG